jgi:hypothetical protein
MTKRVPIPELSPAQDAPASETVTVRTLTPRKVTLIRLKPTLPNRQRLPAKDIPNPLYP